MNDAYRIRRMIREGIGGFNFLRSIEQARRRLWDRGIQSRRDESKIGRPLKDIVRDAITGYTESVVNYKEKNIYMSLMALRNVKSVFSKYASRWMAGDVLFSHIFKHSADFLVFPGAMDIMEELIEKYAFFEDILEDEVELRG